MIFTLSRFYSYSSRWPPRSSFVVTWTQGVLVSDGNDVEESVSTIVSEGFKGFGYSESHQLPSSRDNSMAGRVIAQILIMGGGYVARAFVQAYQQALVNGARGGASRGAGGRSIRGRISAEEASEILGVKKDAGLKDIYKRYDRLFESNDPAKGGSIYIQAKIHHAKQQLEKEAIARGEVPPPPSQDSTTTGGAQDSSPRSS